MAEYIEREQAIQKVKNVMATEWFRGNNAVIEPLQRVIDVQLGRMTAADVAPVVHGRWRTIRNVSGFVACDKCGCWCGVKSNFCPNCGAKMDEEETHDR